MAVLVADVSGFLGMHVAEALLARGDEVVGVDEGADGYDPALAAARLRRLSGRPGLRVERLDIGDAAAMAPLIDGCDRVIDLATGRDAPHAAALDPRRRTIARLDRRLALLQLCRRGTGSSPHLVYSPHHSDALSPLRNDAEEIVSRAHARIDRWQQTRLELAEVYGPWGLPDTVVWRVADAVVAGRATAMDGAQSLSLTSIEDVVEAVLAILQGLPADQDARISHRTEVVASERTTTAALIEQVTAALKRLSGATVPSPSATSAAPGDGSDASTFESLPDERIDRFVSWYRQWHATG